MTEIPDKLFELPTQIQLTLASGYAAYMLSYVGIRSHHTGVETTFLALVYGLIATAAFSFLRSHNVPIAAAIAAGFFVTCVAGIFWRIKGRKWYIYLIRKTKFSQSDDDPSAWASIIFDDSNYVFQIAVTLDDGTVFGCDDTRRFENSPFGPCKMGPDGDVAMYVTHLTKPDRDTREQDEVVDEYYGDLITFIPSTKIKCITMRHKPKSYATAKASVARPLSQSAEAQTE